jgi:hypothetical protein
MRPIPGDKSKELQQHSLAKSGKIRQNPQPPRKQKPEQPDAPDDDYGQEI